MVDDSSSNGPRPGEEAPNADGDVAAEPVAAEHGIVEQRVAPEHFINRELSLLEFNRRVLAQALDESIPLLERLRFLTISSTNLDEFFEVRKASHQERLTLRSSSIGFDGRSTHQLLDDIALEAAELVREQYEVLNGILFPLLAAEGIKVLKRQLWTSEQAAWINGFFGKEVEPILTPVGLDPSHPFPKILNKSLNFIVIIDGDDAFARDTGLGVVQVPRALPRLISLPPAVHGDELAFVLLSSVIHAHVETLFPGMRVVGCHQFRVTRNSELWVDDEEVENILEAIEGELPERKYAEAVRLEVAADCPEKVVRLLRQRFELDDADVYRVNGPVNVGRLEVLHGLVDRPDLKYPPLTPRIPRALARTEDPFAAIRERDILVHHPYESFAPVIDLVRRAASDPDVLAIKQTLYRTERNSAIVAALVAAARNGKQVVAVVELRARFDEAENIDLANQLQEVGAQVVYGIVGYKTHSKMTLIVRREPDGLVRYVHLGTGNYHARTARTYTDLGFLTADPRIAEDVHQVFHRLTGLGATRPLQLLLDAPFTLRQEMRRRIRLEAENARAGQPARIIAKMNALTEVNTIRALYDASAAGVQIDLIVRGACCVRPGVPGISENIRVRSVLGRFLEHSRLFYFEDGGRGAVFASSADWMSRNLYRRVETCFPILDPELKRRALEEDLLVYLGSHVAAWELQADGGHVRTGGDLDPQQEIMRRLGVLGEVSDEDPDLPPGEIRSLRPI
ncbi:polyphosphate kinase 1 [Planctomycetota bacterium]|nr:polyphosphate kinase 1 [Planctomycetota bacterium]